MRGKISVVSELNKGTVFIIEIPLEAEVALTVTGQNEFDTQNAMVNMDSIHSNQEENPMTPNSSKRSKYPQNEQV
jgi:chemotaxis protein histidine kinase CheA